MTSTTMTPGHLATSIKMSAQFDRTRRYRFSLHRLWQPEMPLATFVMLNPSTADDLKNDPTITRCINLARFWGFGGINVVNLFAYRTCDPTHLRKITKPVGKENDKHIESNAFNSSRVILAWGNHGSWRERDQEVLELLNDFDLGCIGSNKSGQPKHPLYSPSDAVLQKFER
jgi:hypothetical protein